MLNYFWLSSKTYKIDKNKEPFTMKIFMLCLTPTKTVYWMSLQFWYDKQELLNMGIFLFTEHEDEMFYREYYLNHIEEMMQEIQDYKIDWNATLDEIIQELVAKQLIFAYDDQYIAIYDSTHQEISKLDLFLDVYRSQIFQGAV